MHSPSVTLTSTAVLPSNLTAQRVRREIWPAAVIAFAIALNVGWICLLCYGLVQLLRLAI